MTGPRLVTGGLALSAALVLAVVPMIGAPDSREIPLGEGLLALALLGAGIMFRWSTCISWAAGLLGLEYVTVLLINHAGIDGRAALVGAALFLMTELAYWSVELRSSIQDDMDVYRRRAVAVVAVAASGAALSTLPLLAAEIPLPSSPLLTLVGTCAAVAVMITLAAFAWRTAKPDSEVTLRRHTSAGANRPPGNGRG